MYEIESIFLNHAVCNFTLNFSVPADKQPHQYKKFQRQLKDENKSNGMSYNVAYKMNENFVQVIPQPQWLRWPLVPKFAGSNPAEAVGFLGRKKSSARLPSEGK